MNFVWNYCNDLSLQIFRRERRFASGIEIQRYLNGASKEGLAVGSAVFQQIAEEYATRRKQHRKVKLRWRRSAEAVSKLEITRFSGVALPLPTCCEADTERSGGSIFALDVRVARFDTASAGARRSLGWIPFKARSVVWRHGQAHFQGLHPGVWDSYGLAGYEFGAGCISEDSRGRWYLNVTVKVKSARPNEANLDLGIDLGLKTFAGFSDERLPNVDAQRFYRDLEPALATAQRARRKSRVKAIHARIANRRKDFLHQLSSRLASALAKGQHSKSVLDAGWSTFRTMLRYKCDDAGVWFDEVDEAFSTQTCSCCASRTGPKGVAGPGIREWKCMHCETTHDRDRNAARNILAVGRDRLAGGIPALSAQAAVGHD
ncbi:RNA-guided endonuclease InsQ/TnpB family protein [Paraburkholderia aromaticivorans]|uniref:RNA-guided endonuclease InsQ/TnpB family protein n=1 Tax=Paraburkholderia aromaticivorans TaxID=2026199 RepID=UPI001F115585|nr:transposase [Paraburkholderia aromaticivorans]